MNKKMYAPFFFEYSSFWGRRSNPIKMLFVLSDSKYDGCMAADDTFFWKNHTLKTGVTNENWALFVII